MAERIHLLLPVHNRRKISVRFAELLRAQTHRDFQLWLIDDGSTDGTAGAVRAVLPDTIVIRGDGSWWWAGCLERGCVELEASGVADPAVIGLMNDDVEIAPEFLERAVAELQCYPSTLLLAQQIDAETGVAIDGGGGVHADVHRLRFSAASHPDEINCLPTRGLFLRWGDLKRAGRFRPKQLPHYLSDYEFTLRAQRCGMMLRVSEVFTVGVQQRRTGANRAELFAVRKTRRLALLFSRRCKDDPRAWSAFVSLAAPPFWRPWLWLKVWGNALVLIARCGLTPVRNDEPR